MGHIAGLLHLGREAMNTSRLPLYASLSLLTFLKSNAPWKQLVEIGNLEPRQVQAGCPFSLSPNLTITPMEVPHRGEYSDTLAYQIQGGDRTLFYCPDIDAWQRGSFDIRTVLAENLAWAKNLALLDGTFYSGAELPGRKMSEVPHPLVEESIRFFQGNPTEIVFVHLNHTNPLWQPGVERQQVESTGFRVGEQGAVYLL
jgi:pyrroloquinoline quinone biosynthesis protein B